MVPWPTGCRPGLVATPAGVQLRRLENLGSRPLDSRWARLTPGSRIATDTREPSMPASARALTPSRVATSWSPPTAGSPGQTRQVSITGSENTPTTSGRGASPALVAAAPRVARADQAGLDHRVGEPPDHLGTGGGLGHGRPLAVRVVGHRPPHQGGGLLER